MCFLASRHGALPGKATARAVKSGAGHGGARSMHIGGAAVVKAIDATLAKARPLAAHLLQASDGELVLEGGGFAVRGSERRIELADIAREAGAFGEQQKAVSSKVRA